MRPKYKSHRVGSPRLAGRWASQKEILDDYPYLESEDFNAVFAFAADIETEKAAEARLDNPQPPISLDQLRKNLGLNS